MCGLHIFCITLLRSQVCICCILPGSMRNKKDQRRNISTRLVAVCPAGNTLLDATRTSVPGMCSTCFRRTTKTSLPRRFRIAGVHLDTHADHEMPHCSTRDSVAPSLSTAVCHISLSFCIFRKWSQPACNCSTIVTIESFRLHLLVCI